MDKKGNTKTGNHDRDIEKGKTKKRGVQGGQRREEEGYPFLYTHNTH